MPFIGVGLHVLIALFFAVHALKTRQQTYWLFILFSFPLLGSLAYFITVYWPSDQRLQRRSKKLLSTANKFIDPGRELREAQEAFEYTPTAQNQMRLAAAQLGMGLSAEAAQTYEQCLQGPFASDPHIRWGAAQACLESGQAGKALEHLEFLRKQHADFRPEPIGILHARALAKNGQASKARDAFEDLLERYGSFDVSAEFAILAAEYGDVATAERLKKVIEKSTQRWTRAQRELNADTMRRLNAAYKQLENRSQNA